MTNENHRLRDSLPIRIGIGLIGFVVLLLACDWIASTYLHSEIGAVGPIGLCALAAIILALGFIFVGIGQTIVRWRRTDDYK